MVTAYVVGSVLASFNWVFLLVDIIRGRAVKGSRLRYVCTTIQWALVLPAFISPVVLIVFGQGTRYYVVGSLNFLICVWAFYDLYNSDDDNWWRRKRKQLRQYISIKIHRPQLAGEHG